VASIRDALMNYDDLWDGEVANLVDLPSLSTFAVFGGVKPSTTRGA
jgi:hypothetical protein